MSVPSPTSNPNPSHNSSLHGHCETCGSPLPLAYLDIVIDTAALAISRNGLTAHLTNHEMRFFQLLAHAKGRVLSNDYLFDQAYADAHVDKEPAMNMTKIWVHRLRPKLKPLGLGIKLTWGTGYALCTLEDLPPTRNKESINGSPINPVV